MSAMTRRVTWPAMLSWPDERMDRMVRDTFRDFFAGGAMLDRLFEAATHTMHIEEFVDDGTCVIRAELPGIDPDKDIELTVSEGMVHLAAKREERTEEERPSGYHSEFHYGRFQRSMRLPEGAAETDVKASYKDGILEVRIPIPKTEAAAATKVPIEH